MPEAKELDLLFDLSIIPTAITEQLGPDLVLRPLASDDYTRGHFELLSVLTEASAVPGDRYNEVFRNLRECRDTYFTIVIVHKASDKILACGTIIVERKFVHSCGLVGHIEDIAVSKAMQGRKLGLRIISALEEIGRVVGCYKIILDCSKDNIPFYEKCGFKHKEFEMVRYLPDPTDISRLPSARL